MQTRDRVGQQFGNYRLIRHIGSGGYAEVYQAEHVHTNKLIRAIKILTSTSLKNEQRAQFLVEARTIANLQSLNSHVVQIHDFGIQTSQNSADDGVPYLVMEYAEGGTLRHLYPHNTQVPLDRIVFYTKQIAEALQCAHDQNPPIKHLDIKPENMLLRSPDHLLLSDFGIAVTGNTTSLAVSMKDKEILGTAAYVAPERLSRDTRRASDQYSLGIVVYEWLCGSLPFDGTDKEILYKHRITPPPPLYPQYSHITKEIEEVVMRALAKEPADRYPKVLEFACALESAIQQTLLQKQPKQQPQLELVTLQNSQSLIDPPKQATPLVAPPQQPLSQTIASPPTQQPTPPTVSPPTQPVSQTIASPPTQQSVPPTVSPPTQPVSQTIASAPTQQSVPPTVLPPTQPVSQTIASAPTQQSISPMPQLQRVTPSMTSPKTPPRVQIRQGAQNFFAHSPQFARDQRFALFRGSGIILNVLSAITIGLLQQNIYLLFGAAIFSFAMFWLCVRIVEEKLALFFGILIACYWGFVGWEIGNYLASLLDINQQSPSLFMGTVFFGASLSLHIWYILRKNL